MHLWPGNGVAIESAIVFYARAAHTLVQELNVGTVYYFFFVLGYILCCA